MTQNLRLTQGQLDNNLCVVSYIPSTVEIHGVLRVVQYGQTWHSTLPLVRSSACLADARRAICQLRAQQTDGPGLSSVCFPIAALYAYRAFFEKYKADYDHI